MKTRETNVAEEIYMALTSKRHARCKPKDELKETIMKKIQSAIDEQILITLVIGFGYHKNPNLVSNLLPDMAEEQAIQRLFELAIKIKKLYQYGMGVKIITSGRRAEIVNKMRAYDTFQYHQSLVELVHNKGWNKEIKIIPIYKLYEERKDDLEKALQVKEAEVRIEIFNGLNVEFWNNQIEYACRNINREGLDDNEIKRRAIEAATKYVIYRRAEAECNLLGERFPGAIIASYNNDSATSLKLWTLRKGYVVQPWQGIGMLVEGRVEVVTQKRLQEMKK